MRLTRRDIARRRLANQRLVGKPFTSAVDVVRRLGAVQAQDYSGAKWGIAQRTRADTNDDVERALTDGSILRTHVLRPTWHFVAAEDIRWMLDLTAPRICATMSTYDRQLGLDETVFARSARSLALALERGKELDRDGIREVLRRARIDTSSPRLSHLMMRAELDGLVCSGCTQGSQCTWALLEERVPATRLLSRDEALGELAVRYFPTRGPATIQDFAWWSGLRIPDATRAVEIVAPELERGVLDGRTYWFTGSPPGTPTAGAAHLLPNYDEFFIGHRDRSAIGELVKKSTSKIDSRTFSGHVVVVDGQLVGGWKTMRSRSGVSLRVTPVVTLKRAQLRAIEEQAARYEQFLGAPVEMSVASTSGR